MRIRKRIANEESQMSTLEAKPEWVESESQLGFTEQVNRRLQWLMDQNNEGQLVERQHLISALQVLKGCKC